MKSQDAHMKQESHQIANAVNLYKNDNNGRVPVGNTHSSNNRNDIVYENNTNGTRAAYMSSMQELVDGGYLPSIPESPTGESYSYYVTEDEDQAVFAVELNFEESGRSNKNSCSEFDNIENDIAWGSCVSNHTTCASSLSSNTYQDRYDDFDSLNACNLGQNQNLCTHQDMPCIFNSGTVFLPKYPRRCSEVSYDVNSEACFDHLGINESGIKFQDYCDHTGGYGTAYSTNHDIYPDIMCEHALRCSYDYSAGEPSTTDCEFTTLPDSSNKYTICSFTEIQNDTQCDGSSNSDYCSCI